MEKDDKLFDARYGTDTAGLIPVWSLMIASKNAKYGVQYQATAEDDLKNAVQLLGIDASRYTFVDLGCGKGRALLIAARLGFSKVIGVEFAPALAAIARSNLAKLAIVDSRVIDGDAAQFSAPDGNTVIYMYNPFGQEIMDIVIENLRRHSVGDLYVIYNEPKCADSLNSSGFLQEIGDLSRSTHIRLWRVKRQQD